VQTTHVFNQADQSGNWLQAAALRRPSCCLAVFNPLAYVNPCTLHTHSLPLANKIYMDKFYFEKLRRHINFIKFEFKICNLWIRQQLWTQCSQ